jgi:putative FmdB family regulatory protein
MPNYKYECSSCGHGFTEFQGISEALLTDCPSCKAPALKRLIGGGMGVIFKGNGFYSTDYKKSGEKKESAPTPEACKACQAGDKKPACGKSD